MADFEVWFEGYRFKGIPMQTYYGYSKDTVIRLVKEHADKDGSDEFSINYKSSGKSVGHWKKHGSRWFKEW